MSIRDELADLLDFHQPGSVSGTQYDGTPADVETCSCGKWSDTDGSNHREHVVDAILARFAVVELPEGEQDDDGKTWYADYEIRVYHTGMSGPEAYLDMNPVSAAWLRGQASEYLAAARDLEARS